MMAERDDAGAVSANYTPGDLTESILAALRNMGKDVDALSPEVLAPVDQFHLGGRAATLALIERAGLTPGMRVLDIAAGTGLAAEAALTAVGPTGHVTAADLSPAMVEKARGRLGNAQNASVAIEDGQALSFADGSFDAVVCSLGLMFFPDPGRGLAEFRRVLRPGGRAAVSVNTVPERSFNTRINMAMGRRVPSLAEAAARVLARRRDAAAIAV